MTKLPSFLDLCREPRLLLALGFGTGLAPRAPGTFGTLAAIPFFIFMQPLPLWQYLSILVVTTFAGFYLCGYAGRYLGVSDHGAIVWDEMVGYWVTMLLAPVGWLWMLYGFLLFRFFDILKPWPINWVDKNIKGGFGVMVDDLIAAVMALAVLQASAWLL